jgi:hypothetical protein
VHTPVSHRRAPIELAVMAALTAILVMAAASRRDFIGDGVRHLPDALSGAPHFGEARWLLFPALLFALLRPLAALGHVRQIEAAIQPVLWLIVACGVVFLISLDKWLRAQCGDANRRAAALWLAGSCAPFLLLFSDIAEPQIAATLAVAGLAYARTHQGGDRGAGVAVVCIALAALIYQGTILALGMLPLVASPETLLRRRVVMVSCLAVAVVPLAIVAAQAAGGVPLEHALTTAFGGERNPLARSFLARPSPMKCLAALLAGPPQGIVALDGFAGLPALLNGWRTLDGTRAETTANLVRLILGVAVVCLLFVATIRRREWRLVLAAAILLILPTVRNQQYAYAKFFVLWPVVVALAAVHCRPRTIALAASIVLLSNGWLLAAQVNRGRHQYAVVRQAYSAATPETCWMTSGWTPPMWYLWPGTTTPILGTLATGSDPDTQSSVLTASLRRCFCDAHAVWTDTTARDASTLAALAGHFRYRVVDLTTIVLRNPPSIAPGMHAYPADAQREICGVIPAADSR